MPDPSPAILARDGWRLRLLAPGLPHAAVTAARPALDALLRDARPAIGFVLLRPSRGGLLCALHHWTPAGLERSALWLARGGGMHPVSALASGLDGGGELQLLAREAALWQRCVLLPERPDPDAYLAAA